MKKIALFIFSAFLAAAGFAAEISQDKAASVATRLMAGKDVAVDGIKGIQPVYQGGEKAYYVVNFNPQGWALISADDMSTPLIGYSPEGAYDVAGVPDNMRSWLSVYGEQVVQNAKLKGKRAEGWDTGASRATSKSVGTRAVGKIDALVKVNWNQGGKYNKYCPSNASGRAVVGCVAVSMAQAMSVVQYPPRPKGSFGYECANFGYVSCNYDNEADYNWSNILSGANDYDDVARLLFHCGVSVRMDYGVGGSGTQNSYIASALKNHFSYPASVVSYGRESIGDDNVWKNLILTELSEGRVVCYAGADLTKSYGHAFNLDGYDGSAYFHINWGWGGSYNGYFSIDNLRDYTMDMSYTAQHQMVIGIRAPSEKPSNITLSSTSVAENKPAGTVVGDIVVESEATDPVYTYEVKGAWSPIFETYMSVPFEEKDGKLVTTQELSASDPNYYDPVTKTVAYTVTITATNTALKASVTRDFKITVKASSGIDDVLSDDDAPAVYYNLQGVKVENPEKGIYIKKQGARATKVVL